MYAYCLNNPISLADPNGHTPVSIREFVESHGGIVHWDSYTKLAIFKLNDRFLISNSLGKNIHMFDVSNQNGKLMAEDYELAYYFKVDNWATYFPGFRWYNGSEGDESDKGFEVYTIYKFLSKTFCLDFAQCIIDMVGKDGKYLGNNAKEIAAECYAHAFIKMFSILSISAIDRGYGEYAQAKEIGYVANDPNSLKYAFIWFFF